MRLDEIRRLVLEGTPDDWHVLEGFPSLSRVRVYGLADAELVIEGHDAVAYLKADLDVSLTWGARTEVAPGEPVPAIVRVC